MQLDLYFLQPQGLLALLALIPLLLLYLLRPKPKQQTIPSLMFLLRDKGNPIHRSFFRRLFQDLLLLFHLLLFLGFAAALAEPYISVPKAELQAHTIIVLDSSASMYAQDVDGVRYERAQEKALSFLSKENTIVLAGERPHIALEGVSESKARSYLENWKPSHEATKLGAAILSAQSMQIKNTRVIVISDFADTDDAVPYSNAVKTIQALGVPVVLEQVGATIENIGIIDVRVEEEKTTAVVKNYFATGKTVQICAGETCSDLAIAAHGTETWSFTTPAGTAEIRLDVEDAFAVDNVAFTSTASQRTIKTLLVTNDPAYEDTFFWHALNAITTSTPLTIDIEVTVPPQLTEINHDLVLFYGIDPNLFVSRTARQTLDAVKNGAAAVVFDQEAIGAVEYEGLLPLTFAEDGGFSAVRNTESLRAFVGMDFGTVNTHRVVTPTTTAHVLATTLTDVPLIALFPTGKGNILYFGLQEELATFPLAPEYPLFWKRMIDTLNNRQRPEQLNAQTGVLFSADTIEDPQGDSVSNPHSADSVGIWNLDDKRVAVNLVHAGESDLSVPTIVAEGEAKNSYLEKTTEPKTYTRFIILGLLILAFLEIIFLKWRGDL